MNRQTTLLKAMLADAILFGTRLAELGYRGGIHDPQAAALRADMERLRSSTRLFLGEVGLDAVTSDDVFPLFEEIERGAAMRSAPCTPKSK